MENYNNLDFNIDFGNFNPEDIETDETINAVFVVDTSYSVQNYIHELNFAFNSFVESMQKSHIAERLFVSIIEFSDQVRVKNGFMPIRSIQPTDFSKNIGGATALFDAAFLGLQNAINYRTNLENSGVETKTLLFIITDGEDNSSKKSPHLVKQMIDELNRNERSAFSFTSVLFGIGGTADFQKARRQMGIEHLAKVGATGDQIKSMIGFISQSISMVSVGQASPTPDF